MLSHTHICRLILAFIIMILQMNCFTSAILMWRLIKDIFVSLYQLNVAAYKGKFAKAVISSKSITILHIYFALNLMVSSDSDFCTYMKSLAVIIDFLGGPLRVQMLRY